MAITPQDDPAPQFTAWGSHLIIAFGGVPLSLDESGAVFIASSRTLVVSDLHLEKGSAAASRGRLVPALDSHDTLLRLERVIDAYAPRRVVCLGDSFHDGGAEARMARADRGLLLSLRARVESWVWISGNHDPAAPRLVQGSHLTELRTQGLTLRHQPAATSDGPSIVGHFHPKARAGIGAFRFSLPCFCVSGRLLIMPAFGSYAGGLPVADPAIRSLAPEPKLFTLHAGKIWRVA